MDHRINIHLCTARAYLSLATLMHSDYYLCQAEKQISLAQVLLNKLNVPVQPDLTDTTTDENSELPDCA